MEKIPNVHITYWHELICWWGGHIPVKDTSMDKANYCTKASNNKALIVSWE